VPPSYRMKLSLLTISMFIPAMAMAAGDGRIPSSVEPGRTAPKMPEVPEGQFEFSIPSLRPSPVPKDVENLKFPITSITVDGSSVFTAADFQPLISPLIGQQKSLGDVMAIATAIEVKYRDAGYLLTRAFVPPQRSKIGAFKIQVIEGFIKGVSVEGVDGDLKDRIMATVKPVVAERPLKSGTVERALLLVNDLPGIQATGLLKPSTDEVGAADMVITAKKRLVMGSASIDNRSSRYSGPWIANTDVAINSLLGQGEQIGAGVSRSLDPYKQKGYRLHYAQPLGDDGLISSTSISRTFGQPGYTLEALDVETDSLSVDQRLSYPMIRSRHENVSIEGGMAMKSAKTNMLGSNISFDEWRTADVKWVWSQSGWFNGDTSADFDLDKGLPVAGASRRFSANLSRANGNPDFTKLTADIKRLQVLDENWQIMVAGTTQHSFSPLLSGEQFSLGGSQFGRGFDPSALAGDQGIAGTIEIHYDTRTGLPIAQAVEFYGFYDRGLLWNQGDSNKSALSSTGLGVRTGLTEDVDANLEIARPLQGPTPTIKGSPGRVYFALTGRF